jgi:putative FmdB family regulatory protein
MPTYEYECTECGRRLERFRSISAPPLSICPACGGTLRPRISGGAGIIVGKSRSATVPHSEPSEASCSLRATGRTCCGRGERCDAPPCGS